LPNRQNEMKKVFTIIGASIGFVIGFVFLVSIRAYGPPQAGRFHPGDLIFVGVFLLLGGGAGLLTGALVSLAAKGVKSLVRRKENVP
jgi:hypothetical protein